MNTLKEVPHLGAIDHAIEVLRASFDHPEADEAIAGLKLLREQAAWAHHTPALLSDADAAADLAGVERPGAEPFGHVTVKRVQHHADRYEFFPAGQTPYLDNADECHAVYTTPPQASQPAVPGLTPIAHRKLDSLLADGYQVTGYSIERTRDDIVRRGAVTCGGMVLWWHGDNPPLKASQPLTDEQIMALVDAHTYDDHGYDIWTDGRGLARAIEQAHGIGAAQKGKP